jgi:sodium transport system permease protein
LLLWEKKIWKKLLSPRSILKKGSAMSSALNRIGVVFFKEVTDNLRDRRSVISALISGLIGPLLVLGMIMLLGRTVLASTINETRIPLPVEGRENAPSLVEFLEQNGFLVVSAPTNPEEQVRRGNYEVVLIIPEEYAETFTAGRPAPLRLVLDTSRQATIPTVERLRLLLDAYNGQIAALRLLARGINPEVTTPLAVQRVDVATSQSQMMIFLNLMPYFIVLVVFLGGMYVIIDTTAGERERGSLEPLLINPIPRWELVIGKLGAAIPFAVGTLFFTLLAFWLIFNYFPVEDYIGIPLSLDARIIAGIFLIALPMVLLASALQMIIATFTRSFKEAQTYVAFLPLVPALPGIGLAFLPITASVTNMLIPTFGQQILINQLLRGDPVNPYFVFISTSATLLISLVLVYIAVKLYQRERILFGVK